MFSLDSQKRRVGIKSIIIIDIVVGVAQFGRRPRAANTKFLGSTPRKEINDISLEQCNFMSCWLDLFLVYTLLLIFPLKGT